MAPGYTAPGAAAHCASAAVAGVQDHAAVCVQSHARTRVRACVCMRACACVRVHVCTRGGRWAHEERCLAGQLEERVLLAVTAAAVQRLPMHCGRRRWPPLRSECRLKRLQQTSCACNGYRPMGGGG